MASSISSGSKYPYPSTINPTGFVSTKLSSNVNYPQWKMQMLCLIESQELDGFIDGTILPPPETIAVVGTEEGAAVVVNDEYRMWKRSDRLVKGWILGSLGEQVLATMDVELSTARDVWTMLKSTLGPHSQEQEEKEEENDNEEVTTIAGQPEVRYPDASAINVADILPIQLTRTGTNYMPWLAQLISLLVSQDLLGFILNPAPSQVVINSNQDNEDIATQEVLNDDYMLWRETDLLLKGWILGSLSEDLLDTVKDLSTSRDVLIKLEETFASENESFIFNTPINIVEGLEVEKQEIEEVTTATTIVGQQAVHYPYPSEINAADFLSVKLNGTGVNYMKWLNQLVSLVTSQGLNRFITNPAPPEVINLNQNDEDNATQEVLNEDCILWRKTDLLLKGWILGSLNEDLLDMVKELRTSRDVLLMLEEFFVPENKRVISKLTPLTFVEDATRGKCYLALYKAALVGDWETAKRFLDENEGAEIAIIAPEKQTVLHVAVGTKNTYFIEKLVERLPVEALMLRMSGGRTAFSIAMLVGNTDAVKIMMEKNPALLSIRDNQGNHPMIHSFSNGKTDTLQYLQSVSSDANYEGQAAVELFTCAVVAGFFDIALDLVIRCPHAARLESTGYMDPLTGIAGKASSFRSGMCLNFFESFIYSCVPLKCENQSDKLNNGVDIESPANCSKFLEHVGASSIGVCERLHLKLWHAMETLVPLVKKIRQKKLEHHQAIQLVRCMCEGIKSSNDDSVYIRRTCEPIFRAAALGIIEVVEEIVDILPCAIWSCKNNDTYILQIAVENRCEKVFNLRHRMNGFEISSIMSCVDDSRNCILHLAGRLAPQHKLNLVSGAALQMQRELQWFQEVEKFVDPLFKEQRNSSGETPAMVFTREHRELVIQGEKWMKDTANSCTIAAALIITVVFAAAITVPGGNNGDTGLPIFSGTSAFAFWLFAISDAISLFTSSTSLLMFLSILTARYAEHDFLHALPKRLILGLLTLFLSITSMIIAFSTTIYLVFGAKRVWILIPLAALSCLPITSFVTLQFPLLRDVFSSTYGHGTFGKKIDRPLH